MSRKYSSFVWCTRAGVDEPVASCKDCASQSRVSGVEAVGVWATGGPEYAAAAAEETVSGGGGGWPCFGLKVARRF